MTAAIFQTARAALFDGLPELYDEPYACDLHHYLYNEPEFYIYYADAEKALDEIGTFAAIGSVQKYEQDNFGEVYTDLSDSCLVANMLVYIIGNELLYRIFGDTEYFNEKWNSQLTSDDLQQMLEIAKRWFEDNPDWDDEIWDEI